MKSVIKVASILFSVLLLVFLLHYLYLNFHIGVKTFIETSRNNRELLSNIQEYRTNPIIMLIIILVIALLAAIPFMPISIFCIVVGAGYGGLLGGIINLLGICVGNVIVLNALRFTKLSKRIQKHNFKYIDSISNNLHPLIGITVGYGIPMMPTILVDLTAIHLRYRIRNLLLPMLIGSFPTAFIYSFGGTLFTTGHIFIGILVLGGLVGILILITLLNK